MRRIRTLMRLFPMALLALVGCAFALALVTRIERTIKARGEVRVHRYQIVRPQVSGRVSAVETVPGERVEVGQLLLQLSDPELEAEIDTVRQNLVAARSEADRLRADIERRHNYSNPLETARGRAAIERQRLEASSAESRVREAKIRLAAVQERLGQAEELFGHGLESRRGLAEVRRDAEAQEERLIQARLDLETAQRMAPDMEQEVRLLTAEQQRILAQLDGQAQLLERDAEILAARQQRLDAQRQRLAVRAQMAGVVTGKAPEELLGRHLVPGEEVFQILDPTSIHFVSWVGEESLVQVRPGQKVLVELVGLPVQRFGAFEGTVQRVGDPQNDIQATAQRSPTDTLFDVEIGLRQPWLELDEGPFYLRGGMQGTAEIAFQYDVAPWRILFDLISGKPQLPEPITPPATEASQHVSSQNHLQYLQ